MSGELESQAQGSWLERQSFLYALGQLTGFKKWLFESLLKHSEGAQVQLAYWQEQLMPLNVKTPERSPAPETWQAIKTATHQASKKSQTWLFNGLGWAASATAACLVTLFIVLPTAPIAPDYLAIVADEAGNTLVSASSYKEGRQLSLSWQQKPEGTVHIWAKSKTDGQLRSLAVVDPELLIEAEEDKLQTAITLEKSGWKLVADAHSLVLSSEARGGSILDAPTGEIIGRGPCLKVTEYTL